MIDDVVGMRFAVWHEEVRSNEFFCNRFARSNSVEVSSRFKRVLDRSFILTEKVIFSRRKIMLSRRSAEAMEMVAQIPIGGSGRAPSIVDLDNEGFSIDVSDFVLNWKGHEI